MSKKKKFNKGKFKQEVMEAFTPRFKSLVWRSGMMFVATSVDLIYQAISSAEFGNEWTVLLGLVLGEVSKYLNRKHK